ncbi:TetR/AcrR family transcriptional regulator [Streptomyces sp. XM4193]|uniref:TetR/AcrR family transcriptional regulator n=1 Tax=Streptomyces sp. XM4193 TaxID=2929782 RepID=UPI001FF827BB|nr:TetR/AcrR family transcriptional regulator [Streptomyces sp. XM4193]MCK1796199.1 TetR/AcrR family transcriptional regulator [Streptomyces sp. XM4193]
MATALRRRMDTEQRRQQLIAVALELFSTRSPDDVSIDDIATAAGISRPLVYHYFPGKHSLYEAAVQVAADELTALFAEPAEGPLTDRLDRVLNRYFDFVQEHGPSFCALLRGGTAGGVGPGAARAGAALEGVREKAYEQMRRHLRLEDPGPRLRLLLTSWVQLVETAAFSWVTERAVPREELVPRLVHDLVALTAVTAAHDEQTARMLRTLVAGEGPDGPLATLVARLTGVAAGPPVDAPGTTALTPAP